MTAQVVSTDKTLLQVISDGLAAGDKLTIVSGAVVTVTQSPPFVLGEVTVDDGAFVVDGASIAQGNSIHLVTNYGVFEGYDINGLGTLSVSGAWYDAGTTDGTPDQSIDVSAYFGPTPIDIVPAIWIETGRRIAYTAPSGTTPEIDDWVYLRGGKDPAGRIVEVQPSHLVVKFLVGALADGDSIAVRKIVDVGGPSFDEVWAATADGPDQLEPGVYQGFGNAYLEGVDRKSSFGTGIGGFVFSHAKQATTLQLGGPTGGFMPPAGANVRIPNVHFSCGTQAEYDAGTTTAQISTNRNNYVTLGALGGRVALDKCNIGTGTFATTGAFSYTAQFVGANAGLGSTAPATPVTYTECVVCENLIARLSTLSNNAFCVDRVSFGCTIDECMTVVPGTNRATLGANTSVKVSIKNSIATTGAGTNTRSFSGAAMQFDSVTDLTVDNVCAFAGPESFSLIDLSGVTNAELSRLKISTTQDQLPSTQERDAIRINSASAGVRVVGTEIFGSGFPGNSLFVVQDSSDVKIRALGMINEKLVFPTSTAELGIFTIGAVRNLDIARFWKTDGILGTLLVAQTVSASGIVVRNSSGAYTGEFNPAGADDVTFAGLHAAAGNLGLSTGINERYSAVYGRQIHDGFRSDTDGFLTSIMIPASATINSATVVSGTPFFDGFGGLKMVAGDVMEIEQDYMSKGHVSFTGQISIWDSGNAVYGTDNVPNATVEMQYDVGAGFNGAWLDIRDPASISAIPDFAGGIRIKFRVTATGTVPGLNGITLSTATTLADQQANLHPIDQLESTFTITGLKDDTEVRIYTADLATELAGAENVVGGTFAYTYAHTGTDIPVVVVVHNLAYIIQRVSLTLTASDSSLPIQQQPDRQYDNP